jgi:hypothetical protein
MTCEEAKAHGLLTATVEGGSASVHNDAEESFLVSLAVYEMPSANVFDQTLYESESVTLAGGESQTLSVDLPACAYQVDVVCGEPLEANPVYGERIINFTFGEGPFCVPRPSESVTLRIKEGFPQENNFVFECVADGFTPTRYDWYYGDGEFLFNATHDNVWYTYAPGEYTVTCTASNDATSGSDSLDVAVARPPYCGDGIVNQESEACDGEANAPYTCTQSCELAIACEDALAHGLLSGEIVGGSALVRNDALAPVFVSAASYQMYAATLFDQTLYDHHTAQIMPGEERQMVIAVPNCAWQTDLVCGTPLATFPDYDDRLLDFDFGHQGAWCVKEPSGEVSLDVKEYFPQGGDYVFECNAGFTPSAYHWYLGDGDVQLFSANQNVFHTYAPGEYTVTCTATDGVQEGTDTLAIVVGADDGSDEGTNDGSDDGPQDGALEVTPVAVHEASLLIAPWFPQGLNYVFICQNDLENAVYDWDFGDGQKLVGVTNKNVWHTFSSIEGTVSCTARNEIAHASATLVLGDMDD